MRVVWLVMPNLLYYLPGRPGDGCEAGAAADRAAGSYRRLQCRGMLKRAPRAPPPTAALEAYPLAQGSALWAQDHTAPAVRELRSGCGGALTPVQRRRRRCVLTTQMQTAGSRCSECRGGLTYRA